MINYFQVANQPLRMGWICPRCNQGVSPDVKTCPCNYQVSSGFQPGIPITTTTTTVNPEIEWQYTK